MLLRPSTESVSGIYSNWISGWKLDYNNYMSLLGLQCTLKYRFDKTGYPNWLVNSSLWEVGARGEVCHTSNCTFESNLTIILFGLLYIISLFLTNNFSNSPHNLKIIINLNVLINTIWITVTLFNHSEQ